MKRGEEELSTSLKEKRQALDAVTSELMTIKKERLQLERKEGITQECCYVIEIFVRYCIAILPRNWAQKCVCAMFVY